MKILLTGSNGFVGSHLAAELLSRGHRVIGLGRSCTSRVNGIAYLQHDLRNPLDLVRLNEAIDVMIHCAALASPWASPSAFHQNNVLGTKHVVDAANSVHIPHLIYISSSSVFYEPRDQTAINEESFIPAPHDQINEYSRTKLLGEHACQAFRGKLTILRPRAVFGPRDTVLLPRILRAAQEGRLPRLTRSDGQTAVGDLIYIDSLVSYIVKAAESQTSGCFNLTNNEPVAISSFVDEVLKRLGYPLPTKTVPVGLAMFIAGILELVSGLFLNYREPPITRFGVSVFAYSKTFDQRRTLEHLGPPKVSVNEGLEALTQWWKTEGHKLC